MSCQRDAGSRHSQLLGTREGSGFPRRGLRVSVTALTDSLDGIPENPATRGNPHREGAGGNPAIWGTRPHEAQGPRSYLRLS